MPDNRLPYFVNYLPLLMQIVVASAIAGGMVTLSWFLGKHRHSRVKEMPYECGMTPVGDARGRFSVKFYLVAMLFILFDVEAVFLYPWAIIFRNMVRAGLGMFGFWEMMVYLAVILVGFWYVWKKGALDWTRPEGGA